MRSLYQARDTADDMSSSGATNTNGTRASTTANDEAERACRSALGEAAAMLRTTKARLNDTLVGIVRAGLGSAGLGWAGLGWAGNATATPRTTSRHALLPSFYPPPPSFGTVDTPPGTTDLRVWSDRRRVAVRGGGGEPLNVPQRHTASVLPSRGGGGGV